MTPGSILVKLSAVLAIVAFIAAIRWARGREASQRTFKLAYHGMTGALLLASFFLMWAILTHDYRFHYVIGYSSNDLPLLYLISAFWAGQEGTFLLWALVAALIGYALFQKRSWEPAMVMAAYVPTVGFLIGLMLDPGGNPFNMAAQVPADGRGLNPLLQDPWMATHPPMVFIGYAALTVPAVLALVALLKRDDSSWLGSGLRWSLAGFVLLGVGIILGGFWAYKVLGWGGYWGWDPVENASLFPWIAVIALLHGILVQKATGSLKRTNLILALSTYILVMYATFLTRSGVLADFSVHSFPAGTIFRELVAIMIITLGVSVFALLLRRKDPSGPAIPLRLGWPMVLTAVVFLMIMSGILILVATSWPILSSLAGNPATIATSFYNQANLPLFLLLFGLLSVAPFLTWSAARAGWWKRLLLPAATAFVISAAAVMSGAGVDVYLLLFFMATFAVASAVVRFVMVAKVRVLNTGAAVAHTGLGLMFMGVVAAGVWGTTQDVELPLEQPVEALGVELTYLGHVHGSEPEHQWMVSSRKPGGTERRRPVTMYNTAQRGEEQNLMRKPAIFREWFRDVYVVPTAIQEPQQGTVHEIDLSKGQPVTLHGSTLTFQAFNRATEESDHGMMVECLIEVTAGESSETVSLPFGIVDGSMKGPPVALTTIPGTSLRVGAMSVEEGVIRVVAEEKADGAGRPATMVVQASSEPLMTVLWVGTLLLCMGCIVAVVRRVVDLRMAVDQDGQIHLVKKGEQAA